MQVRESLRLAALIAAWGCRILAVLLCLLTAALCFSSLASLELVASLSVDLAYALPASIAGYGLVASPFGGVFRLDFAVLALLLFCVDAALSWAAARLA